MENINIGNKVKEYRGVRGMSLRDLADKAGMSPSMLSQIENNSVNPSINTLKNIAEVLNVPMFKFFKEEEQGDNLIVRRGEYRLIGRTGEEVAYKLLTNNPNTTIECCLMDIPAGQASTDVPRGHNGEEVGFVISGEVDISVEGQEYHLNEGDAINIPSMALHRWINRGTKDVRVIFAVTPPGF